MPDQGLSDTRLYTSLSRIESRLVDPELMVDPREDRSLGGITIFIPNWNHRTFLPRSLNSALSAMKNLEEQGFSTEIMVIDDASRDGSQKLLRTIQALYNEPRLKILCLDQNYGHGRLWNLALRLSKFRYVCRLDADNELVPENLALFLRSALNTRAAMVYGNLIDRESDGVSGLRSNQPATLRLTEQNYVDSFSIVDAKRILSLGGYTRRHPYTPEDWEMILHLIAEEQRLVFVPVTLGYYYLQAMSAREELKFTRGGVAALRRTYAQTGTRGWDRERVGRIYHPDVGYLDNW